MDLARNDVTRAALQEAAAKAPAKVPVDIAELLAKVSPSAVAIGPQLAACGAACVADLPRLFEVKPELVDTLSSGDRNKLLMLVGKFRASIKVDAAAAPAVLPAAMLDGLDATALAAVLQQLGNVDATPDDAAGRRAEVEAELLSRGAQPSLDAAVAAAAVSRLAALTQQLGVKHVDAEQEVAAHRGALRDMWVRFYAKYLPSKLPRDGSRAGKRILIIGPGFGLLRNPGQAAIVKAAGFTVDTCFPPDPEQPGANIEAGCALIRAKIRAFRPHALTTGSKGGRYLVELWDLMENGTLDGTWNGAAVMINAHPSCHELPRGVPVVVAHGASDTTSPRPRDQLAALVATGGHASALLYYTAGGGSPKRPSDRHDMSTLLVNDCRACWMRSRPWRPAALPSTPSSTSCARGAASYLLNATRRRSSWATSRIR